MRDRLILSAAREQGFVLSLKPNKILLVRLSALGDVIQSIPILTMLREGFPEAKIGWVIESSLAETIEDHQQLDYLHLFPSPVETIAPGATVDLQDAWQSISEIVSVGYDVAIDVQGTRRSAMLPYLARITRRVGFGHDRQGCSAFYTEKYLGLSEYMGNSTLHVEHMAVLARAVGGAELRSQVILPVVPGDVSERMQQKLSKWFSRQAPIVALSPATRWESKHWPEKYWSTLLTMILDRTKLNVIIVGASNDGPLVSRILDKVKRSSSSDRIFNAVAETSIKDLYALFQKVQVSIGPDSGPLHIAGAAQVPLVIGIYGPTSYRRTAPRAKMMIPFSTEGVLPCQPCHERICPLGTLECMVRIRPEEVFDTLYAASKDW